MRLNQGSLAPYGTRSMLSRAVKVRSKRASTKAVMEGKMNLFPMYPCVEKAVHCTIYIHNPVK